MLMERRRERDEEPYAKPILVLRSRHAHVLVQGCTFDDGCGAVWQTMARLGFHPKRSPNGLAAGGITTAADGFRPFGLGECFIGHSRGQVAKFANVESNYAWYRKAMPLAQLQRSLGRRHHQGKSYSSSLCYSRVPMQSSICRRGWSR